MRMILWTIMLAGCAQPLVPVSPRLMEPGHAQRLAAEDVAGCVGQAVSAEDFVWVMVDGFDGSDSHVLGRFVAPDTVQILAGYQHNRHLSAHELTHAVARGDPGHGSEWFGCLPDFWRGAR